MIDDDALVEHDALKILVAAAQQANRGLLSLGVL